MTKLFANDSDLAAEARTRIDAFRSRTTGVPYERKGILYSEMFFLFLCATRVAPRRILESGRARGQSTELLARMFPELPIVSIEYDEQSPDVPVAAERLVGFGNVDLRFGDATRLLPRLVQKGDIVLIDGPKGFRGVRLALSLLATGKPSLVFLHDAGIGTAERIFLDKHLGGSVYSDDPAFVAVAHDLDAAVADTIPLSNRFRPGEMPHGYGYGYGLACLPSEEGVSYGALLLRAAIEGFTSRLFGRQAAG